MIMIPPEPPGVTHLLPQEPAQAWRTASVKLFHTVQFDLPSAPVLRGKP